MRPNQGNIRYFQNIDSHIKAYFTGFIAADGCVQQSHESSVTLSITLNIQDKVILDKLKSEIGNEHTIRVWSKPQTFDKSVITTFCRFQLSNKLLIQDLFDLGIKERKTFILGNIINNIPQEFRNSFIIGYFDGDGSVTLPKGKKYTSKKTGITTIRNCNEVRISIRGTYEFLKGISEHLNLNQLNLKQYDSTYRLDINNRQDVLKFFNCYKNCPFYLERKYSKFIERL